MCLESIADTFKTYGKDMTVLKANIRHIYDRQSILDVSRLSLENYPRLQHFSFLGSTCYPDLSHLRSLRMINFTAYTNDSVVKEFLKQSHNTIQSLTLGRITIDGSFMERAPALKSLSLRRLSMLNVAHIRRSNSKF